MLTQPNCCAILTMLCVSFRVPIGIGLRKLMAVLTMSRPSFIGIRLDLAHPASGHFILGVVGVSSQAKMLWVYARGVVTRVQHRHPLGDRSNIQLIRNPVSTDQFTISVESPVLSAWPKLSRPQPFPTLIGTALFKILFESLLHLHIPSSRCPQWRGLQYPA